ncbi:MAG: lipoyl synthase [Bacillota bacterium]|nr:lipoyl synthase [Bacillota bacterium]
MAEATTGTRPEWLRVRVATGPNYRQVRELGQSLALHTVCEEARCPNVFDCWERRTATFMILGDTCTRACRYCAVKTGWPGFVDWEEPERVAEAVAQLGLRHAVVTCVTRDDIPDGGAAVFAATVRAIRRRSPGTSVEVLTSDFLGRLESVRTVMEARPDIFNHNIETVRRLHPEVRLKGGYERSLAVLAEAHRLAPEIPTKSGLMVGLGESFEEIEATMRDLLAVGVSILTIGQYLRPSSSKRHVPVARYYPPEEFRRLKERGLELGFRVVESGPFVRSSYHADEQVARLRE